MFAPNLARSAARRRALRGLALAGVCLSVLAGSVPAALAREPNDDRIKCYPEYQTCGQYCGYAGQYCG